MIAHEFLKLLDSALYMNRHALRVTSGHWPLRREGITVGYTFTVVCRSMFGIKLDGEDQVAVLQFKMAPFRMTRRLLFPRTVSGVEAILRSLYELVKV